MSAPFTVNLSFDNGPIGAVTPLVLDILAQHAIKASFFVVGRRAAENRDLLVRAHAEGHWIGNHTWSHSVPLGHQTIAGLAEEEVEQCQRVIDALSHPRKFFRPFGSGGLFDPRLFRSDVVAHLEREGYTCVLWNVVPRDWADPDGWVETAIAACTAQAENLVVLHDADNGAMNHLDRFIRTVRDRGGRFVQDYPAETIYMDRGKTDPRLLPYVTPYKEAS